MFDLKNIIAQVRCNCDISDALYGGHYSVCSLFLRLRDLFKWEKGLDPWFETAPEIMLTWIDAKEQKWETLADNSLKNITIYGKCLQPLDSEIINDILLPHNVFYGSGYARNLKPTFFLGEIEANKEIESIPACMIGTEYARDLFASPSMVQNDHIVYRRQVASTALWDQLFYATKSGRKALDFALSVYGCRISDTQKIRGIFKQMVSDESLRYIYHEIGEIRDSVFDRELWREIIATYPHSSVELLARAVKDLLADTGEVGTLSYILSEKRQASLGFYTANLSGISSILFPEIKPAFDVYLKTGDWAFIETAVNKGYRTATKYAHLISEIHVEGKKREDPAWAKEEIAKKLLNPLGL